MSTLLYIVCPADDVTFNVAYGLLVRPPLNHIINILSKKCLAANIFYFILSKIIYISLHDNKYIVQTNNNHKEKQHELTKNHNSQSSGFMDCNT